MHNLTVDACYRVVYNVEVNGEHRYHQVTFLNFEIEPTAHSAGRKIAAKLGVLPSQVYVYSATNIRDVVF
jgi:hypothetical protein